MDIRTSIGVALAAALLAPHSMSAQQMVTQGRYPALSADGSRLVFYRRGEDGTGDVFAADADGSHVVRITDDAANDALPRWSPDGGGIVFVSDRDEGESLYVMDADGGNVRRLTTGSATHSDPMWGVDGTILFSSNRSGRYEIYSVMPDGSGLTQLTDAPNRDGLPAMSPDGALIAFQRTHESGNAEIWVMNRDGSHARQLTNHDGWDGWPQWAGDSAHVLFSSTRSGSYQLWTAAIDDGTPTLLLPNARGPFRAVWDAANSAIVTNVRGATPDVIVRFPLPTGS